MNTLLLALPELKTWGMSLAIMAAERKNYSVLTITVLFAILFAASAIFFLVVEISKKHDRSKKKIISLSAVATLLIGYSAAIICFIRSLEPLYWNIFRDCQLINPGCWLFVSIPFLFIYIIIAIVSLIKEKKKGVLADRKRLNYLMVAILVFAVLIGLFILALIGLFLMSAAVMTSM